jgi:NADPH2 dehydrogenase
MRMADPKPAFSYLVSEIARRHPLFAYMHLVEPRVTGSEDREVQKDEVRLSRCIPLS